MLALLTRVGQLQFDPSPRLQEQMHRRETARPIASVRGNITDRRARLLATTEFGYRVFVDPVAFPPDPRAPITELAQAIGVPVEKVAAALLPKLEENRRRMGAAQSPVAVSPGTPGLLAAIARTALTTAASDEASAESGDNALADDVRPIRYVRVSDILDEEQLARVKPLTDARDKARHIPGVHLEQRSVRAYPAGALGASIVGKVGIDHEGRLGAERTHDENLSGADGRIRYVRDVMGRPLWMGPGSYVPPEQGSDLRLSIDLEIQRMAEEELRRGVEDADAAGGRLIAMDSLTGEILALVDLVREVPGAIPFEFDDINPPPRLPGQPLYEPKQTGGRPRYLVIKPDPSREVHPALARNRCVEDVYEPGSTFKTFVWAAVTELGRAQPEETFNTFGGRWYTPYGRLVQDVTERKAQSWREVLINSSNIGMSQAVQRLSFDELRTAVLRFGFGQPSGIGLPGEAAGMVTSAKAWNRFSQTSVSFGAEIAVTPVQMVRAFSVFARPGELAGTLPPARLVALGHDAPERSIVHRVISTRTATLVRDIIRSTASNMEATMLQKDKNAKGWRYTIFGKSGTAKIAIGKPPPGKRKPPGNGYYDRQYLSSFIAGGPAEHPRLVILVIIDDPGPDLVRRNVYYGSHVAGPVVRRLMDRVLSYLGVPPSAREPVSAAAR